MALIFSGTMPLISFFAMLFFSFKYYIDKYNLTFVYNKEFEGGGVIKKQVLPFLLFSVYLFQVLNLGYFALIDDGYFKGGLIFITVQTLLLIFLNVHYNTKKKEARENLSRQEQRVNCVNLDDMDRKESVMTEEIN
jgi:hypothetical protein